MWGHLVTRIISKDLTNQQKYTQLWGSYDFGKCGGDERMGNDTGYILIAVSWNQHPDISGWNWKSMVIGSLVFFHPRIPLLASGWSWPDDPKINGYPTCSKLACSPGTGIVPKNVQICRSSSRDLLHTTPTKLGCQFFCFEKHPILMKFWGNPSVLGRVHGWDDVMALNKLIQSRGAWFFGSTTAKCVIQIGTSKT